MKSTALLILVLLPVVTFAGTYRETRNLELPAGGVHVLRVRCGAGELTLKGIEGTDIIKKLNYVNICSNGRYWLNMFDTFTFSDNSPI